MMYATYGTLNAARDNAVLLRRTTWRIHTAMNG